MRKPLTERVRERFDKRLRVPPGVTVAICVFPAFMTALFYLLRPMRGAMDWFSSYIARPVRGFFGMLSSIYPVSLMELLCTVAVLLLIYYIVKAIRDSWRRRRKWFLLGRRILWLLVVSCYFYGGFCWLWSSGYYAAGFAEKSGFEGSGVNTEDLIAVTHFFAGRANELSSAVQRDGSGAPAYDRGEMLAQSRDLYDNISGQFPMLRDTVYAPKPMYMYSWLMTITGYTGVYFALTGESMVNIQQHPAYMPATAAHEIAHQLGVHAEDEAGFAGILACTASNDPLFAYSGYLSGLGYLLNALARADYDEYTAVLSGLSLEVRQDRSQNAIFWANATSSNLGIDYIDSILSSLKRVSSEVVDNVYDNYLKSQEQELGLQTYGKCVDLLVEYFAPVAFS